MSDPIARAIDIYASRLAIRPRHPHTHSRAQLEPKPLIEPSAAGCRRPGDEDEPRDVGSAHSRAASAPQSRRRSRVALLAAAGACSNCSMILACQVDEQAHCISWSCRASGWEARAAGGSHALIAESCNERQENRKRGGGKGAGAANLTGEGRTMSVMKKEAEDPTSGADLEVDLAHPGRS